jgi:hypothetical protein
MMHIDLELSFFFEGGGILDFHDSHIYRHFKYINTILFIIWIQVA